MEIYIEDTDGKLQKTTLLRLMNEALVAAGFKMDNVTWSNENYNLLGIIQENKNSEQITTNIVFNNDENSINGLSVYVTPIKRVIDEDNTKQLI